MEGYFMAKISFVAEVTFTFHKGFLSNKVSHYIKTLWNNARHCRQLKYHSHGWGEMFLITLWLVLLKFSL